MPTLALARPADLETNPWWAVKLPSRKSVLGLSIQIASDCACVADLQGTQIWVGPSPWTSPGSAVNYTLCATVPGIMRGQRRTFACSLGVGGAAPMGQFIAIWRPTHVKKALTLCEVDVIYGPAPTLQSRRLAKNLRRLHADGGDTAAAMATAERQLPLL